MTLLDPGTAATTCDDWTNAKGTGLSGVFGMADNTWWKGSSQTCSNLVQLYCVETP